MARFDVDDRRMEAALAAVVSRQRRAAARNPHALLRDKPLPEDYPASEPVVVEPLHRSDLCLESDGACAFVVCAPDVAAGCRTPPVHLLGATQAIIGGYHNMFLTNPELPPRPPADAVPALLGTHGAGIEDVDVLATYDATSANVVFDVESIGCCEPGEGVDWVHAPPSRSTRAAVCSPRCTCRA